MSCLNPRLQSRCAASFSVSVRQHCDQEGCQILEPSEDSTAIYRGFMITGVMKEMWFATQMKGETNLSNHWGRVTHICVNKLTIIGSDNGLSPGCCLENDDHFVSDSICQNIYMFLRQLLYSLREGEPDTPLQAVGQSQLVDRLQLSVIRVGQRNVLPQTRDILDWDIVSNSNLNFQSDYTIFKLGIVICVTSSLPHQLNSFGHDAFRDINAKLSANWVNDVPGFRCMWTKTLI